MVNHGSVFPAAEYDEEIRRTLPYYEEFYRQTADAVQACQTGALSWLDVGCGTGKMAELAFKKIHLKRFVCLDSSSEMIQIARARFALPCAEFQVADMREMDYDNEFDVVTAIQVNHYLQKEERIKSLQKCWKALKVGGIFISFENFAPNSGFLQRLYLDRWKTYELQQGKDREECERHIARYGKAYFPITLSEQLDAIKSCGFREAELLWLSGMQAGFLGIK
ncbi:methyltransferase domain-containing protein [Clostridium sp. D33t1_170424_F3]|uniref:methyltransferase domain-containing protein n=1 Tax=Clostridium sp. D33t1_170424_F3 TaxID=2787099 RepID=UPI0018AA56FF